MTGDRAGEVPIEALPSALERLDEILARARGRAVALFLDYDGTLAPIAGRPEEAELPAATRALLDQLSRRHWIAIISGRDLEDLRDRVGLPRVFYAGSHGFRLAGPGGFSEEYGDAPRFLPALARAEAMLAEAIGGLPGIQLERKRYALAVHYRRAPADLVPEVRRAVEAAAAALPGLRLTEGRKLFELRPAAPWGKGEAIGRLLAVLGLATDDVFAIFVGDDVTDEEAFRFVQDRGLAIVVRGRTGRTNARYALADSREVDRFLRALARALDGPA